MLSRQYVKILFILYSLHGLYYKGSFFSKVVQGVQS